MQIIYSSLLLRALFFIMSSFMSHVLWSQCTQTVMVTITSIDFRSGCDFGEANGLDAVLEIRSLDGSDIYLSEFENLSQVRSPQDSVLIDLSVNPNSCGNNDVTFSLGTFSISDNSVEVMVDIFDRDNIFPCSPYFGLFDDDLGRGNHTFDFAISSGTIDVGTCMSYNYNIEIFVDGYVEELISDSLCYDDERLISGEVYDINSPQGIDTIISSVPNACDTIVTIDFTFLSEPIAGFNMQIVRDSICMGELTTLSLLDDYDSYIWDNGQSSTSIEVMEGTYTVTVTDDNDCTSATAISIYNYPEAIVEIIGDTIICNDEVTLLSLSQNDYQSILWSDGSSSSTLNVSEAKDYSVELIDIRGCSAYDTISIDKIVNANIVKERLSCDPMMIGTLDSIAIADNGCEQVFEIVTTMADDSECMYIYTVSNIADVSCLGGDGIIEVIVTQGEVPYQITIRQESPIDLEILSIEILRLDSLIRVENLSAGMYSFIIENDSGDMISTSFDVNEEPSYEYAISDDIQIELGDSTTLSFINSDNPNATWQWMENGNILCEDCDVIIVAPLVQTTYIVQVTDDSGCDVELSVTVDVIFESDMKVYIPNIINLSATDENRILNISGSGIANIISLNIYDRWGSILYSEVGIDASWDGTSDNALVEPGLYILCVEIEFSDNQVIKRCQDITVLR